MAVSGRAATGGSAVAMDQETVAAYLARVGVTRPAACDAPALRALHRAHQLAVPFENLSLHLGEPISLDERDLVDKIVHRRRGGFCYELNGTFALLLEALGAQVSRVAARVYGEAGLGPPFDHLALIVHAADGSGPWLADVGFGSHSDYPLLLSSRDEQDDPAGRFRLADADEGDIDVLRDGKPQYRIETRERTLADCVPTCWWQSTSPLSHFTRSTICSRLTPGGRVSVSGRLLIQTEDGTRTEQLLDGDDALLAAYRDYFGVVLTRVPDDPSLPPSGAGSAASVVGAAGERGPRVPVGAVVGDDDGRLGVAQRVVGGQRAVVRVDLPVAALARRAGGKLLAAGFGHGDRGGHDRLGVRAARVFPQFLEPGAAQRPARSRRHGQRRGPGGRRAAGGRAVGDVEHLARVDHVRVRYLGPVGLVQQPPVRGIAVEPLRDRGQRVARPDGVVAGLLMVNDQGIGAYRDGSGGSLAGLQAGLRECPGGRLAGGVRLCHDRGGPARGADGGVGLRGGDERASDRHGRGRLVRRFRDVLYLRRPRVPAGPQDLPRAAVLVR